MKDLGGGISWGADTPISMPEPITADRVIYKDMGGFCSTTYGIGHNFTRSDLEVFTNPIFSPAPQGLFGEIL